MVLTRLAGSDPLLLAGVGSGVVDVLAAMSSSVPVAGAVTVTLYAWLAPLASDAIAGQVTTLPLTVPPPVALTKVAEAGSVSVTTTLAAAVGPLFATVIEYVTGWAASTVAGPVFVVTTSAWLSTVVVTRLAGSEPLLLFELRSPLAAVLATMLVKRPAAGTDTVTAYAWLAPLASDAITGHVTTFPDRVPPPVTLTNVRPAGNVSVTTTPSAFTGPAFCTVIA